MVRLIKIRCSGRPSRASTTETVAATSDSSRKKCHGCKPSSLDCARDDAEAAEGSSLGAASVPLIEVAELIVQSRDQRRAITTAAQAPAMPTRYGKIQARRLKPLSIGRARIACVP